MAFTKLHEPPQELFCFLLESAIFLLKMQSLKTGTNKKLNQFDSLQDKSKDQN
ncbi:hypothetical protein [Candidatus Sarmatiella mevalonica]|uniref:hypothetical protein n=1 Tax=Candidatus Sarmatiella mevalonica TaxID=2770581 RepID=UPI001924B009|nr:hypothetical protein [Candidatus Sarmatiella mevalonica]